MNAEKKEPDNMTLEDAIERIHCLEEKVEFLHDVIVADRNTAMIASELIGGLLNKASSLLRHPEIRDKMLDMLEGTPTKKYQKKAEKEAKQHDSKRKPRKAAEAYAGKPGFAGSADGGR